jgi:uncharacterized protein (TIGR03435 family)
MKRLAILVACLLPLGGLAVEPKKTFEVASVKPSAPSVGGDGHNFHMTMGARFGPGTADSTRWACDNCSLGLLLTEAYSLKRFQITGPKWLDSERFDIVARVAEGATKDDLRLMQQNLLAERFGLKVHIEKKEMQVYDLVVGKNPPKLKEAAPAKPGADGAPTHEFGHGGPSAGPTPMRMGAGGWADHSAGRTVTITMHGNTRHQAVGEDMQQFADVLAAQLDRPVTDSTGLTGKYDFLLTFSGGKEGDGVGATAMMHGGPGGPGGGGGHADGPDSDASQPPLPKAIQDQLGLRLEAKKGMADILIVDHLERVPSEN